MIYSKTEQKNLSEIFEFYKTITKESAINFLESIDTPVVEFSEKNITEILGTPKTYEEGIGKKLEKHGTPKTLNALKTDRASVSGGTSSGKKIIPFNFHTPYNKHYKKGGQAQLRTLIKNGLWKELLLGGKSLILAGTQKNEDGVFYGDVSTHAISVLSPNLLEKLMAVKSEIAVQKLPWTQKKESLWSEMKHPKKLTHIGGVTNWVLDFLEFCLQKNNAQFIEEVFPILKYFSIGGVVPDSYIPRICRLFKNPQKLKIFDVYNATEGFISYGGLFHLQFSSEKKLESFTKDPMVLNQVEVFYELLTAEKKIIPLSAAQGSTGELLVTNKSGLIRHRIGDRIKVVSTQNNIKILYQGRSCGYLNLCGEEFLETQAIKILQEERLLENIENFHVTYEAKNNIKHHLWLIETKTKITAQTLKTKINTGLKTLHDFSRVQAAGQLGSIEVKILNTGTFKKFFEKEKNGGGGQTKILKVSENFEIVEKLLEISEKK